MHENDRWMKWEDSHDLGRLSPEDVLILVILTSSYGQNKSGASKIVEFKKEWGTDMESATFVELNTTQYIAV